MWVDQAIHNIEIKINRSTLNIHLWCAADITPQQNS